MSTVEKAIRLYAWKTNYQTFRIVQGEANSRTFNIQLFSTTIPVDLTNCSVMLYAVKPDSTVAYVECDVIDTVNGLVSITLSEQMAAVEGTVDCWVQVVGEGGTDLRFEGMNLEVGECDLSEKVRSSDEMQAFLKKSAQLTAIDNEVKAARGGKSSLAERENSQDVALSNTAATLRQEIKNADDELKNLIEVQKARIDLLSQLEAGSTTGDAELQDIRVGADGVTYPTAGDAVRNQFIKSEERIEHLSNDAENVNNCIFDEIPQVVNVSSIPGIFVVPETNAIVSESSIEITSLPNFTSYWYIAEKDLDIWVPRNYHGYAAVVVGEKFKSTSTNGAGHLLLECDSIPVRYRSEEGTLPTEDSKLHISAGSAVAFTMTAGEMFEVVGATTSKNVKESFREEILTNLPEKVDNLSTKLFSYSPVSKPIDAISGVEKLEGINAEVTTEHAVNLYSYTNVDTYYFYSEQDEIVYFKDAGLPQYVSISVMEDAKPETFQAPCVLEGRNARRLRTLDNNLPNRNNKLSISAGMFVAVTVSTGSIVDIIFDNKETNTLNNDIQLNSMQLNQVRKNIVVEHTKNSGESMSLDALNVYIPVADWYVKYVFAHTQFESINADVWRVANAYVCDNSFINQYNISTSGEWECAVHLKDRDDFSGGRAHGDEIMTDIVFFADGVSFIPENLVGPVLCEELRIVQKSYLYDPADHTTQIAVHTSEHIFTKSSNDRDLVINQTVKWLGSYNLTSCYLAMFPIAKTVSDTMYSDVDYTPVPIVPNTSIPKAKKVCVYSADVFVAFGIDRYVEEMPGGDVFLTTDNGGLDYNKCYYIVCSSGQVTADTLWKTSTFYNIRFARTDSDKE